MRCKSLQVFCATGLSLFAMRRRCGDEGGFALVLALSTLVVLTIVGISLFTYTTSSQRSAQSSANHLAAQRFAEAGLMDAYSLINYQNTTGGNPSSANLLGCNGVGGASDTTGPSNCATPSPKTFCVTAASPCTAASDGTAGVYGYFSGTNPGSFGGYSVPASTWLVYSTGYALNTVGARIDSKTVVAMIKISPLDAGAVASVWNHIFITAPLTSNSCQVDFNGNGITVNVPIYVIGNLCLSGQNASVQETTGGQPIDMQVGGKLVMSGSGAKVGADSLHGITSGVVVGGCTTVAVTSTTTPCSPASFSYWVKSQDTFIPNDAPSVSAADAAADYANFDPGPKHSCQSGTNPAPLASSVFDNDATQNNSAASFELTPTFSYSCVSQSGSSVGQLTWDNVNKKLTIAGSIFLDGSMTISQSLTYSGTAVIELAGTVTINGNSTTICATGPPCDFNAWQGTSGNKSMLTLAPLATNTNAITFTNNTQVFQGSLWTQPSSGMTFQKNGVSVEGPISVGKFDATFNNASFKPMPVIVNMPVGAPIPPNTSASVGPLVYVR
jgi:Tfp pilus assembly protein PilX